MHSLARMLAMHCLYCGCVADNEITEAGATELANALKINNTLHTLYLERTFCEAIGGWMVGLNVVNTDGTSPRHGHTNFSAVGV